MERRRGGSGGAWGRRRCGESELAAEGSLLLQSSENDRNFGYRKHDRKKVLLPYGSILAVHTYTGCVRLYVYDYLYNLRV